MMSSLRKQHGTKRQLLLGLTSLALGCQGAALTPVSSSPPPVVATPEQSAPDPRYRELPKPGPSSPFSVAGVNRVELKNGITLYHLEQRSAPLVSLHWLIPGGASLDPTGKSGLTALSLDMLDEGAGKRSALEISDELGRLATDYSAETGVDFGTLSLSTIAENFEPSLSLLSDIVERSKILPSEFDRRKQHFIAQAIARSKNPSSLLNESIHEMLFQGGYASSPTLGRLEDLKMLRLGEVKAHLTKLLGFRPTAVVVGAITLGEAQNLLEKYFAKRPRTDAPPPPRAAPEPPGKTVLLTEQSGASQSALAVVRRAGPISSPDYFPELVMVRALGESFTSRINLNLREDKGYTYGAFASFRRYLHTGYLAVTTNVKTEVTAQSVAEIFKELAEMCEVRPFTADEHGDSTVGLLLGFPMRFEGIEETSLQVMSLPLYSRPIDYLSQWTKNVRAVGVSEMQKAALPYCDTSKYQVVVVGDGEKFKDQLSSLGLSFRAQTPGDTRAPLRVSR